MSPDIQSFDPNEDPIVLGSIQSTAKGQTEISAKIPRKVAQRQSAFAELQRKIINGTLIFFDNLFDSMTSDNQKAKIAELKHIMDTNNEIKLWADSQSVIEPLPDNPDIETMLSKLKEIVDRARELKIKGQELTDAKDRKNLIFGINEILLNYKEFRKSLKISRKSPMNNFYNKLMLNLKANFLNELLDFLKNASGKAEADAEQAIQDLKKRQNEEMQ